MVALSPWGLKPMVLAMSPSRNSSYDERTNREDQPSITLGFRNFNLGHAVISAIVLLAGGGLWIHGDATHQATANDMASRFENNRQVLVQEISNRIDQRIGPIEQKLSGVEEYEKSVNALKIEIARLTQAINDMERLPRLKASNEFGGSGAMTPVQSDRG